MARKLCFNVFAALAGLIGSALGSWIGQLLFINVLGMIPLLPKLLSWPVEYGWYALTGIATFSLFAGFFPCSALCNLAKTKFNYGLVIWGGINVVLYIKEMIIAFLINEFSFTILSFFLAIIVAFVGFTLSGFRGKVDLS